MLKQLRISNFLTITEATLNISKGFVVFTGETGAGKSIFIEALSALLGGSIPKSLIKLGEDNMFIEATFALPTDITEKFHDITFGENELVVFRKIYKNKPSVLRINQQSSTVQSLKTIMPELIQIVSQHEQLKLFSPDAQLKIIDAYGGKAVHKEKASYLKIFREWKTANDNRSKIGMNAQECQKKIEFLEFKIEDVKQHEFFKDEEDQLDAKLKELRHVETLVSSLDGLGKSVKAKAQDLEIVQQQIPELESYGFVSKELNQNLKTSILSLQEVQEILSKKQFELSHVDAYEIQKLEARLKLIFDTKKTYHAATLADLLEHINTMTQEKIVLEQTKEKIIALNAEIEALEKQLEKRQKALYEARNTPLHSFKEKVENELLGLEFQYIDFLAELSITKGLFDKNGGISCNFLVSTLPGHQREAVKKVMSGGEVSRLLLAIKSVANEGEEDQILVFDEIDTGIGGVTAKKLGKHLSEIAKKHQLLAITHLPQIASQADQHFFVKKVIDGNAFDTSIEEIDKQEKNEEYSRMTGHMTF